MSLFIFIGSSKRILFSVLSGEITNNVLRVAREARQHVLGPFSPSFNIQDILIDILGEVSSPFVNFYGETEKLFFSFNIFISIFSSILVSAG